MKVRTWSLAVAASLLLGPAAHALRREWGPWKPGQNLSASFWPSGAAALVNRKERVSGYMLNWYDYLRYQGDTAALNAFLKDVEKVQGPRSVLLIGGDQRVGLINPRVEGMDWTLSISANSHVGILIPTDGRFKVADLQLPATVALDSYGEISPEIKQQIANHERRRTALKKPE